MKSLYSSSSILLLCTSFYHKHVTSFVAQLSNSAKATSFARITNLKPLSSSSSTSIYNNVPYFATINQEKTKELYDTNDNSKKTVVIAGATGCGRAVVRESIKRGYNTISLVRNKNKISTHLKGSTIMQCNVEHPSELQNLLINNKNINVDTVISCLASASGLKKEAYDIDYQATLNCMNACINDWDSRQFILLSAFCVRNPLLQLQQAKLKFEAELTSQTNITYSIVRPTAFFKSVSGQLDGIQQHDNPYVLFGDGSVTKCNPISEEDLATYMVNCLNDKSMHNKIMNIGGPDTPLTNKMLGEMMFKAINKEPKFAYAPTGVFDMILSTLTFTLQLCNKLGASSSNFTNKLDDIIETTKIGKYYAVEDMLTTDPNEKFGTITMQEHYNKIALNGQDPFTPVRATALISRILEIGPLVIASLIPACMMFNNPQIIQKMVMNNQAMVDVSNNDISLSLAKFF